MKKIIILALSSILMACSSTPSVELEDKIPENATIRSFGHVVSIKAVSIDQSLVQDGMYVEKRYGDQTDVTQAISHMKKESSSNKLGWIDDFAYKFGWKKKEEPVMKEYQEVIVVEYPFNLLSSIVSSSDLAVDQKVEITKKDKKLSLKVLEDNLIH